MLDWLKNNWFRLLTLALFLACCAGLVWAIVLKSPVFIASMVGLCAFIGLMSWSDFRRLTR